MNKKPLIAIVGPTASGKTKFAIELAKAFSGEIVCADSMQIYKELSISTAKPTDEEKAQAVHHMVDIVSVNEPYSVAQYVIDAKGVIDDIHSRCKLPILAGGTGLYIDSLLQNVEFSKEENADIRKDLQDELREFGGEYMLSKLSKIDPESARNLHPNNTKRILRALEIYYATGKTMSQQISVSKTNPSPYNPMVFGLNFKNRDVLYDRINKRVDQMVSQGIVDEARWLFSNTNGKTATQAIGCKEFLPFILGECSLDEAAENLKMQTRRYAKRQLTWFRRNENINWLYLDEMSFDEAISKAKDDIKDFLEGSDM